MSPEKKIVPFPKPEEHDHRDDRMIVQMTISELRQVIREELAAMNGTGHIPEADRDLTAEEAAKKLNVNVRWVYVHCAKLPFAIKHSRKCLRFSERGLDRWREAKKKV